jgi:hypothetical protein
MFDSRSRRKIATNADALRVGTAQSTKAPSADGATVNKPLSPKEISDFVDHRDDLALERFAYKTLLSTGWWANHGGFYRDPLLDKYRQFDVQGGMDRPRDLSRPTLPTTGIRVAAECKNVDPRFPIVISRVPRALNESYHCLLQRVIEGGALQDVRVIRSTATHSKPYHPDQPVGKSILQYQRDPNAKPPEDPFSKWSQALSSCASLIQRAFTDARVNPVAADLCFIFPALVVADGGLWTVDYDENGARGEPQLADEATFFLGQDYDVHPIQDRGKYGVSHLHIYTKGGFTQALQSWNNPQHPKEWEQVYRLGF